MFGTYSYVPILKIFTGCTVNIYTYWYFSSDSDVVDYGAKCYDESGKLLGKFVTRQGNLGLAILRISDM